MVIKYIVIFSATLFTLVATIFIVLVIISPGKPKALTDNNSKDLKTSISEKIRVQIGGIRQGMFIRSKNTLKAWMITLQYVTGNKEVVEFHIHRKYH